MNFYARKLKGIRSNGSIIREMIFYGFSNKDIVELAPAKLQYVKSIVAKIRTENLYNKMLGTRETRFFYKKMAAAMYSENEDDYGFTGSTKYKWADLSYTERALIDQENHKELCIFAK